MNPIYFCLCVCVQCVIWDYLLLVARLRLSVWRVVYVCIWLCVCKCRSYSESSIYASDIQVCLCVCLYVNVCYQGNSPSLNKPFVCFGCSLLWACCPPGCSLSALFESLIKALPLSPLAPSSHHILYFIFSFHLHFFCLDVAFVFVVLY